MIKKFIFILLITFTMHATAQSKEEQQVNTCVEDFRQALLNGDKNQLEKLFSDNLSYGHSNGVVEDKSELITKYTTGVYDFVTMDLTAQTVKLSGNVAVVRHKLDGSTADAGKPGEAHLFVLMVWQKNKGKWQLLARQAVKQVMPG